MQTRVMWGIIVTHLAWMAERLGDAGSKQYCMSFVISGTVLGNYRAHYGGCL